MQVGTLTALLKLDTSEFDKGLNVAEGKAQKASSVFGRIFETAAGVLTGNLLTGAVTKIGEGLLGAAQSGFDFNNAMEQARAKLNAFNKDSDVTNAQLEYINQEASKTPFAFEEMVNAFAGLSPAAKSAGLDVKDLLKDAEVLAASNPAEGLEGAAFALREAVSGDFTSAIERFNLPRQYINQLKEEGVPNVEIVRKAMQQMGYDMDLVSSMAATSEGRWSTFTDTLKMTAGVAMQPIFDAWSNGLGQVNDVLAANQPLITSLAQNVAGMLSSAISFLFNDIIPALITAFNNIKPAIDLVLSVFTSAGSKSNELGGVIQQLQEVWVALQPAITQVVNNIRAIVTTVFGAVSSFLADNGDEIKALFKQVWDTIVTVIRAAVEVYKAVILPVFTAVASFIAQNGDAIKATIDIAWNAIKLIIGTALALIQGVVNVTLAAIRGDWQGVLNALQQTAQTVWGNISTFIQSTLNNLKTIVNSIWNGIKDDVTRIAQQAVTGAINAFNGIKDSITGKLNEAKGAISGLRDGFVSAASDIGSGIINGIKNGIANGVEAIKEAAASAARSALKAAMNALGIKSPSTVFRDMVGKNIVAGMIEGIYAMTPALDTALASVGVTAANNAATNNGSTTNNSFNVTLLTNQSSGSAAQDIRNLQQLYANA